MNPFCNQLVRSLHALKLRCETFEATKQIDGRMSITYNENCVKLSEEDWLIVHDRLTTRLECKDFYAARVTVDVLLLVCNSDDLMRQFTARAESGAQTTTVISRDKTKALTLDISPKFMLEALLDRKNCYYSTE